MRFKALNQLLLATLASVVFGSTAIAQTAEEGIEEYRRLLAEGNPAELFYDEGLDLWEEKGKSGKSLAETCDLGLGVGVIKGAFAKLPRYFKDVDKVQDLEMRIVTCMKKTHGITEKEVVKGKWGKGARGQVESIATYIAAQSTGMQMSVSTNHPKEKYMYDFGKYAFFIRSGPFDFSCASCHSQSDIRIRLQGLPNIVDKNGARQAWTTWPAYRVGKGALWTMQRRIEGCYRQQRMAHPIYGSDVTIALSTYMAKNANGGGEIQSPGIKR